MHTLPLHWLLFPTRVGLNRGDGTSNLYGGSVPHSRGDELEFDILNEFKALKVHVLYALNPRKKTFYAVKA